MVAIPSANAAPMLPAAFEQWNALMGDVVGALGTAQFPQTLESALHQSVPFEMMNGFVYSADGRAHDLYNDHISGNRSTIVDQYLLGAYELDPFYAATRAAQRPQFLAMRALVPASFDQSDYYRSHYEKTGIVDECGFVFDLPEGAHAVLSVSQVGATRPFNDHALQFLRQVSPLISALCAKHWSPSLPAAATALHDGALPAFHEARLTQRENEIVALMLKGHATLSIAAVLRLSVHTVKVHRRNIYTKLNISSQTELLRMHLSSR